MQSVEENTRETRQSRKGLIAGAGAVLAALAGKSLVKPESASAGTDGDVVLGSLVNDAGGFQTGITSSSFATTLTIFGQAENAVDRGALYVKNTMRDGAAVLAHSTVGAGVIATTDGNANGVQGTSPSAAASGVYGENTGGGFGIAGRSNQGGGIGVLGEATGSFGIALKGVAEGSVGGVALHTERGIIQIYDRSGLASINGTAAAPKSASAPIPITGGLSGVSFVIATIRGNVSGVWVQGVTIDTTHSKITIHLNKAVSSTVKVGWLVLN